MIRFAVTLPVQRLRITEHGSRNIYWWDSASCSRALQWSFEPEILRNQTKKHTSCSRCHSPQATAAYCSSSVVSLIMHVHEFPRERVFLFLLEQVESLFQVICSNLSNHRGWKKSQLKNKQMYEHKHETFQECDFPRSRQSETGHSRPNTTIPVLQPPAVLALCLHAGEEHMAPRSIFGPSAQY